MTNRKAPLEKFVQRAICDWLHLKGYFFWRANNVPTLGRFGADGSARFRNLPKYTPRGIADILIVNSGELIALEVKREGALLRPEQAEFGVNIAKNGGSYHVVHSLEEVIQVLGEKRV